MERDNVRVVLASEYPQIRSFLSQIVEQEQGVEIVGQAPDAVKTLTLARSLHPDVVIVDCYLPHTAGTKDVPLSRINGLDAAQAISAEMPRTRVMLLNNLDKLAFSGGSLTPSYAGSYCMESGGACVSVAQWPQALPVPYIGDPVFARVAAREGESLKQRTSGIADRIIFFGALGFAAGWLLTLTMVFANAGVALAILGATTAIVGLLAKLSISSLRRVRKWFVRQHSDGREAG